MSGRATVRASFNEIFALLPNGRQDPNAACGTPHLSLNTDGHENLLWTGAKAYYRKGGIWLFSGYSANNSDINKLFYGDIYQ